MLAYVKAKKKIINYVKENGLEPGDKMLAEVELAEELDISRLTLREAMNALKNEGLIYSIQGKGTFVTGDFNHISDSLNVNYSITEMIEASGSKAGTKSFVKEIVKANELLANVLRVQEGTDVIMCARIRTADDEPVVYSMDYLSPSLAPDFLSVTDENVSLYEFIEDTCSIRIGPSLTELIPVCADENISNLLEIDAGSPLLKLKVSARDLYGNPLIFAVEYLRPDKFKFFVTRGR